MLRKDTHGRADLAAVHQARQVCLCGKSSVVCDVNYAHEGISSQINYRPTSDMKCVFQSSIRYPSMEQVNFRLGVYGVALWSSPYNSSFHNREQGL